MSLVRWTPEAAEDITRIVEHIRADSAETARRVARQIIRQVEELRTFPHRGRLGREKGTRELVLSPLPYIVVYRVRGDDVQILHRHHGARDWGRR